MKAGITAGRPSRRRVLGGIAAGALLPVALGARSSVAEGEPVKIGVMNTFTTLAKLGNDNFNGMNLYFEQVGWKAGGRKIELIKEDDEFNPQIGLQKLRKLVESDKVALCTGVQASNVMMACLNYVQANNIFFLCSGAGTDAITGKRLPYLFRSSAATSQTIAPMANWIAQNVAKDAVIIASDYTGGHDVLRVFKEAFAKNGGKITKEIYPPLNTVDYSPYLTDIASIGPKICFEFFPGPDAARFTKQFAEMRLKDKCKMSGYAIFESDNLPAEGDAAIGGLATNMYAESLDTPENKKFRADYKAKFGEAPSFYSDYGYVAARIIAETLNATKGSTDKDKMAQAMAQVKFIAPRGPFRFDPETHNVIENIYIKEVVKVDGQLTDKILATYKNVKQPAGA
jgi:branched-chain amino acid transport system substrate-binding protein